MAGSEAAPVTPDGSVNPSSSSLLKDGPVMCMMNKRLRALRKKFNRILQIEESKAQGKVINKEQEDVLKSKVSVMTLIDEYDKLKQPLSAAIKEEIAEREKELMEENDNKELKAEDRVDEGSKPAKENEIPETPKAEEAKGVETAEANSPMQREIHRDSGLSDEAIAELLKILYFAHLFDISSQNDFASMMWTKTHERTSCLSYDYVRDETTNLLGDEDLDALSLFGSLMVSRPPNATLSHKSALQECVHHARQWLLNSDRPIDSDRPILPGRVVTYSDLRERLNRILSSEYFTMTPELQTVSQQTAAAAATAAGQYVTQILVQETSAEGPVFQTEGATTYYPPQDQSGAEQQFYQTEENSAAPVGAVEQSNSVGVNSSYVAETNASFEIPQSEVNEIPVNTSAASDQDDSQPQQLPFHSQLPQPKQQQQLHEARQQLEPEPEENQQLQPERKEHQQHPQYHSQNGGTSRGYQGQKGARGMGYGGGGRGRGYINGRGSRGGRGGGYSNGRGQYYDQGNYYPRNYYSGRGRGGKGGGVMYNLAAGSSEDSAIAGTN
eukprot:Gb_07583 [translate_table: standard]